MYSSALFFRLTKAFPIRPSSDAARLLQHHVRSHLSSPKTSPVETVKNVVDTIPASSICPTDAYALQQEVAERVAKLEEIDSELAKLADRVALYAHRTGRFGT